MCVYLIFHTHTYNNTHTQPSTNKMNFIDGYLLEQKVGKWLKYVHVCLSYNTLRTTFCIVTCGLCAESLLYAIHERQLLPYALFKVCTEMQKECDFYCHLNNLVAYYYYLSDGLDNVHTDSQISPLSAQVSATPTKLTS